MPVKKKVVKKSKLKVSRKTVKKVAKVVKALAKAKKKVTKKVTKKKVVHRKRYAEPSLTKSLPPTPVAGPAVEPIAVTVPVETLGGTPEHDLDPQDMDENYPDEAMADMDAESIDDPDEDAVYDEDDPGAGDPPEEEVP
jgi:TATA-binding protein-associated factor Taf7